MSELSQITPPHQPTYKVNLSHEQISAIIALTLPGHDLIASDQLESGKSFNNRIYFIVTKARDRSLSDNKQNLFVLKVSGHCFGASKVQNEVGSLLLFQEYCSSVPAPRIIAWCEDGTTIKRTDGHGVDVGSSTISYRASSEHSWILMTRLDGRLLKQSDLSGQHGTYILQQLARFMAAWRTSIPNPYRIGNVRVRGASEAANQDATLALPGSHMEVSHSNSALTVGGLLLSQQYSPAPLFSPLSYYTYLANDQLFRLRDDATLQPLCIKLEGVVQKLIDNLPEFSFMYSLDQPLDIKFSHMDFAPRNILISDVFDSTGQGPEVTGIIDVEFAAFLPAEEEFINMTVRQPDDWTPEQYETLSAELVSLGCKVPHLQGQWSEPVCTKGLTGACSCDSVSFEGLGILVKVIDNIAPWYIQEGSHEPEQLNEAFEEAAAAVQKGIKQLNRFLSRYPEQDVRTQG